MQIVSIHSLARTRYIINERRKAVFNCRMLYYFVYTKKTKTDRQFDE